MQCLNMDFKNLCQKIDVDSIRAKIPAMPSMPALPQIKMPKSMPKLKSRKIFRSSREDVNSGSPKQQSAAGQLQPMPPADFINTTPTRISTVSSLFHQTSMDNHSSTYRSAGFNDEDYPSPRQFQRCASSPMSPIRTPIHRPVAPQPNATSSSTTTSTNTNGKLSLTEKIQKGYKDISEFKFQHIFAKKTVVRKDNIEVNYYVERYDEERTRDKREQDQRDHEVADNYRFNFKVSQEEAGHSNSVSPLNSPVAQPKDKSQTRKMGKSMSEQSGDESGLESSPPKRKPATAATKLGKVLHARFQRSVSEDSQTDTNLEAEKDVPKASAKTKGYKQRVRRLTRYVHSNQESGEESATESASGKAKASKSRTAGRESVETATSSERKRKAPLSPQQSDEQDDSKQVPEKPATGIKQNFQRFQKSIKRQTASTEDSEDEETANRNAKTSSKTEKLTNRILKFRSRSVSNDDLETATAKEAAEVNKSPMRGAISNKLQTWKKSFKKKPAEAEGEPQTGDETSPGKQSQRSGTLMNKLKYIRSRKNQNSTDDPAADEAEDSAKATRKASTLEEKFEQARQKTMKKVNEKMQQMKFFHKSQDQVDKANAKNNSDSDDEEEQPKSKHTSAAPTVSRRSVHDAYEHEYEPDDDIEEITTNIQPQFVAQKARAAWTSKPILSEDSMESDTDGEFPRVLIHQDNSDLFESTLIIAVTRPILQSPIPKISEILPDEESAISTSSKSIEWVPNKEIIKGFRDVTPPSKRALAAEAIVPTTRRHARKLSVDDSTSDSDSWIPETIRNKQLSHNKDASRCNSAAELNRTQEYEEPWRVHNTQTATLCEDRLYKTKNIDIFEKNKMQGGVIGAFEDFDDELRNAPVVKIAAELHVESFEKDSSEDPEADDDNSSRVTKILVKAISEVDEEDVEETMPISPIRGQQSTQFQDVQSSQFGNSRESLIANFDENEEMASSEEDDRPPSAAPSPPPSMSPPPPPLPQRRQSVLVAKTPEALPPPLPSTKPPILSTKPPLPAAPPCKAPPQIPERTASMNRAAKPLVKTSSLRLAYSEQVKPSDVGKVNKLISHFEPETNVMKKPRIISRRLAHEDSREYSDAEIAEVLHENVKDTENANKRLERDPTLTPTNTPKPVPIETKQQLEAEPPPAPMTVARKVSRTKKKSEVKMNTTTEAITTRDAENNALLEADHKIKRQKQRSPIPIPTVSLTLVDRNSNYSRPSSEYGSPLEYPSSLTGSTETTPIPDRRQQHDVRSRRSMTRDHEHFYSFDSDEENSYYSISSTGSSRYIVEI